MAQPHYAPQGVDMGYGRSARLNDGYSGGRGDGGASDGAVYRNESSYGGYERVEGRASHQGSYTYGGRNPERSSGGGYGHGGGYAPDYRTGLNRETRPQPLYPARLNSARPVSSARPQAQRYPARIDERPPTEGRDRPKPYPSRLNAKERGSPAHNSGSIASGGYGREETHRRGDGAYGRSGYRPSASQPQPRQQQQRYEARHDESRRPQASRLQHHTYGGGEQGYNRGQREYGGYGRNGSEAKVGSRLCLGCVMTTLRAVEA